MTFSFTQVRIYRKWIIYCQVAYWYCNDIHCLLVGALLQTTEAELTAVKEDLVNLSNSKSEDINKDYDPEVTNKMVKKILNKIFKQMKEKFSDDNDSNKSYSGQNVVDVLAQEFPDVAQLLNSSTWDETLTKKVLTLKSDYISSLK